MLPESPATKNAFFAKVAARTPFISGIDTADQPLSALSELIITDSPVALVPSTTNLLSTYVAETKGNPSDSPGKPGTGDQNLPAFAPSSHILSALVVPPTAARNLPPPEHIDAMYCPCVAHPVKSVAS